MILGIQYFIYFFQLINSFKLPPLSCFWYLFLCPFLCTNSANPFVLGSYRDVTHTSQNYIYKSPTSQSKLPELDNYQKNFKEYDGEELANLHHLPLMNQVPHPPYRGLNASKFVEIVELLAV